MGGTLLLADDSITIQKVVELTFAETDHRVVAVSSGRDLFRRLPEVRPDLVLCDVVMPDQNGYEVCQALKSDPATLHLPVILLTGTFEPFDRDRALAAGCDAIVTKPFEARELIAVVEDLLARSKAVPPSPGDEFAPLSGYQEDVPSIDYTTTGFDAMVAAPPVEPAVPEDGIELTASGMGRPAPPVPPEFVTPSPETDVEADVEADVETGAGGVEFASAPLPPPAAAVESAAAGPEDETFPHPEDLLETPVSADADVGAPEPALAPPEFGEAAAPLEVVAPEPGAEEFAAPPPAEIGTSFATAALAAAEAERDAGMEPHEAPPVRAPWETGPVAAPVVGHVDFSHAVVSDEFVARIVGDVLARLPQPAPAAAAPEAGMVEAVASRVAGLLPPRPLAEVSEPELASLAQRLAPHVGPLLAPPAPGVTDAEFERIATRVAELAPAAAIPSGDGKLSDEDVDRIAHRVVELTGSRLEQIAWEVIPDMAELLVRQRIAALEKQAEEEA